MQVSPNVTIDIDLLFVLFLRIYRILRSYPLIAGHSICMRFFENPSIYMLEDLDLMEGVRDAYKILVDPNVPICSTGKTFLGISWCLEIAKACRKILFEVPTPPSSSEQHHLGPSRKRLSEGPPSSSLPNQSLPKKMKLSLVDSGQADYPSLSDFPVDKDHSSDLQERNNPSGIITSTEEVKNLGHHPYLINQQQQRQQRQNHHHIYPSGLSSVSHIDSRSSSTEKLSLVTESIPALSLGTTPIPNYPITPFPPTTAGAAIAAATPMMFYTCSDDAPSDLCNTNSINNFLDCENFLQQEDHDIANHYIPDDISNWLLQLSHKEER